MNEKTAKKIRRLIKQINPQLDSKHVTYSSWPNNPTTRILTPGCIRAMYQAVKRDTKSE